MEKNFFVPLEDTEEKSQKLKEPTMVFMEFLTTNQEKLVFIGKNLNSIFKKTNLATSFEDKIFIDFFPSTFIDVEKYEFPDFLEKINVFMHSQECIFLGSVRHKNPSFLNQ